MRNGRDAGAEEQMRVKNTDTDTASPLVFSDEITKNHMDYQTNKQEATKLDLRRPKSNG